MKKTRVYTLYLISRFSKRHAITASEKENNEVNPPWILRLPVKTQCAKFGYFSSMKY